MLNRDLNEEKEFAKAMDAIRLGTATLMASVSHINPADALNIGLHAIVNASDPIIETLFKGDITYNDRLAFVCAMLMACIDLQNINETQMSVEGTVNPKKLAEACRIYMTLTGKKIDSYLPPALAKAIAEAKPALH